MAEDDFTAISLDAAAFRCTSPPSNPRVMPCHSDQSRSISHLKTTLLLCRVKQGKQATKSFSSPLESNLNNFYALTSKFLSP